VKTLVYKRPWIYPAQLKAIFNDNRYAVVEASTKCFVAGTLVKTSQGHKRIESIEPDNMVLSWGADGYKYNRVVECFTYADGALRAMIKLHTKWGVIHATADHEFRFNGEWVSAIELARRAMEASARNGRQVLRQQSGEAGIQQVQGARQARHNQACVRWLRVLPNCFFRGWKVPHCESASCDCSNMAIESAYDTSRYGESQKLRQRRQSGGEFGNHEHAGQYSSRMGRWKIWPLNRKHQWKQQTDRRNGGKDTGGICALRHITARVGGKIWGRQKHGDASFKRQELEAYTIGLDDIYGYELLHGSQPVYDLCVENAHNYCITEQNILVHNTGKTVGCIVWLFEQAMQGKEGQNFWWVAPVADQANIAFDRMRNYLPRSGVYTANLTSKVLTLANGARIWFKSADKPDSLYGEDVYAAVVDEASRVKDGSWHAVRSTLTATQGKVRIIGNVKGRKNWFYALSRRAQSGQEGYSYSKLTAYDAVEAGVLKLEEVEDAKAALPEHVFRELYLAEPADDGGNPFDVKRIDACATLAEVTTNNPIVWGWDVAKSVDWTVGIGLDQYGQVCRFERFQKPWAETIASIREITGDITAIVDSTGAGDPIADALQRGSAGNFTAFHFSQSSKQKLMEGLALAISKSQIKIVKDSVLHQELLDFEYIYTQTGVKYSAPAGCHDDTVCALALAVHGMNAPEIPTDGGDYIDMMRDLRGWE